MRVVQAARVGRRGRDAVALLLLAAYCAFLLRKTLLQGGAMVGYDLFTYFYPAKAFAADALRRGELPLWNPYVYFGAPFLANVQMAALYPLDAVFYLLDFPRAVALSQWLHLALAAGGMYALGRWGWGLDGTASTAGAVVFAGSGFFAAHMGHLNQVHAAAWLPWIALAVDRLAASGVSWRALARRSLLWLAGGGAAVALQLTAGHTQEAYYSLFALGLLALGFSVFPPARAGGASARGGYLLAYALVVANGALLAAAQLLPTLELTRLSYRQGGVPIEEAVAYAVERTDILETVLPTFWSLPSQEVTGYVGVVALTLAAVGVAASSARRLVAGLVGLTLLALTLAMGAYTPLFYWLHRLVPLFNSFRAPGRWVLVSTFALAALAALGAQATRYRATPAAREGATLRAGLGLAGAAALLGGFIWRTETVHAIQWLPHARVAVLWLLAAVGGSALCVIGPLSPRPWPRWLLIGAMGLELALAAREAEYNRPNQPALYADRPAIGSYLAAALRPGGGNGGDGKGATARVLSAAVEERLDPARFRRAVPEGDPEYLRYASMREALKPDLSVVYGLPTVDGYDGGLLPTADYARFKSLLVTGQPPVPHLTLPPQLDGHAPAALLGALNVRYLLTDGRHGAPGTGWRLQAAAPGAAWLYENGDYAPRAFFVSDTVVERDPEAALRALRSVDLTRVAVLDAPPPAAAPPGGAVRAATVARYAAQSLEIEVGPGSGPGLLVVTDSFYPGWRAVVDGRPAPVLRADLLFRAVPVPAGAQRVRLWFDPLSVKLGAALSVLAVASNGAALWWWRRRR